MSDSKSPQSNEALIDSLSRDVGAGWKFPRLSKWIPVWLLFSVASILAVIAFIHFRPDLQTVLTPFQFRWMNFSLILTSLILAGFALRSGIPGRKVFSGENKILILLASVISVVFVVQALGEPSDTALGVGLDLRGILCSLTVGLLSIAPAFALLFILRSRYAPVHPVRSGRLLGLAAGALSAAAIGWHCPVSEGVHVLIWHFLPVVLIGWTFSRLSKKFLRF